MLTVQIWKTKTSWVNISFSETRKSKDYLDLFLRQTKNLLWLYSWLHKRSWQVNHLEALSKHTSCQCSSCCWKNKLTVQILGFRNITHIYKWTLSMKNLILRPIINFKLREMQKMYYIAFHFFKWNKFSSPIFVLIQRPTWLIIKLLDFYNVIPFR